MCSESTSTAHLRQPAHRYSYDAGGLLVLQESPERRSWKFWNGDSTVNELRDAGVDLKLTWLRLGSDAVAELVAGHPPRTTLLACAISGSVLLEADNEARPVGYAPHGMRSGTTGRDAIAEVAFNGAQLDIGTGCYLLGPGHHRPYSPTLGLFLAPDRASPFAAGGLNALSYCAGDPVNRSDPSGHFWKWVVAGIGIAVGVVTTMATFGAAAGAVGALAAGGISALTATNAGAIGAATLGVAAVATEVAAVTVGAMGHEGAAAILGFVGLGLGVAGGSLGMAVAKASGSMATKAAGTMATKRASFASRVSGTSAPTTKLSTSKGSLMDEIIGLPRGTRQEVTVKMMRSSGRHNGAGNAPRSLYADSASEAAANQRGYPRMEELSRRGQRNAMANAQLYIRDNALSESMFDFDMQGGFYNIIDRTTVRWNPAAPNVPGARVQRVVNVDDHLDAAQRVRRYNVRKSGGAPPPSYEQVMRQDARALPSYKSLFG